MSDVLKELSERLEAHKREFFLSQKSNYMELFNRHWIADIESLLTKIEQQDYSKFENINNLFSKLTSCLRICDFLESSQKLEVDDTDQIIITLLISLAEAAYRLIKPSEKIYENLVKWFFKPVEEQLIRKITSSSDYICETWNCDYKKPFDHSETLYYMRNDYIHNHNHLGRFFKTDESSTIAWGLFYYTEKWETKLIEATTRCDLTYKGFLAIFLEAFKKNIEKYIGSS